MLERTPTTIPPPHRPTRPGLGLALWIALGLVVGLAVHHPLIGVGVALVIGVVFEMALRRS
jgi:hypothetical protein